jgi:DnaJ-domain-containing protein 1
MGRRGKNLLVINDLALRQKSVAESEKILAKIDRLESSLEAFRNRDLIEFRSWYELSFREETRRIEEARSEYESLAQFHNWVIAEARMRDLSTPQAFAIVREEAACYLNGDEATRCKIDGLRAARERFIAQEMEREAFGEFDSPLFSDEEEAPPPERTEIDSENLRLLAGFTDKQLRNALKDGGTAVSIISNVLALAETAEELRLFLRIWSAAGNSARIEFSKDYKEITGQRFTEVLEDIRAGLEEISSESDLDEPPEEFISRSFSGKHSELSVSDELALKTTYRKLVRLLHPDLNTESSAKAWLKSVWDRTQNAYQQKQLGELNKLQVIALIRLRFLDRLTLHEIRQSASWLGAELETLASEVEEIKRVPAWGFSRKRKTEALARKIGRELDGEFKSVKKQIDELHEQHRVLELLSRCEAFEKRNPRKRRKRSRKQPGGRTSQAFE